VLQQLENIADLKKDEFIILAGQSYIKPIEKGITNITEPLEGLRQGERVKFLINELK
jgi:hypothetical protein